MSAREANALLKSITDGFVALDRDWRVSYINDPGLQILSPLGKTRENLLGRDIWSELPATTGTAIEENFRRATAGQVTVAFEVLYAPIGRWLYVRAYPATDGLTIYFLDIHERKQQEARVAELSRQLSAQTALFDQTLSHINDFAYVFDRAGRFTFINQALLKLWGLTLAEAVGKNFFELPYPAELAARLQAEIAQVVATRQGITNVTPYTSPTGHEGYYEYIFQPVFAADGSVSAVAGSTRDITARQHAETRLREMLVESATLIRAREESEDRLRSALLDTARHQRLYETILSTTPDLVYVFDRQHRFTYANKALLAMWGRTWEESIGKNCLELGYEPWHAAMHGREIDQVVATRKPIRGEVAFNGTNGRRFYDYIFTPVIGSNGEVESVAGTTRDVTEQHKATATTRFLSDLARDLALISNEEEIIRHTVSALGRHMGAHRCYFLECLESENLIRVSENWVRDDDVSLIGSFSLFDFGGLDWWREYSKGDFTVSDTENHPLINPAAAVNYALKQVRSYAVQPVKRTGAWTIVLAVTEKTPRVWIADEMALLENVAARVWPLVERARTEAALLVARDKAVAAARAKDDFLAALSHELRTPLNPILLIASDAAGNEQLPVDIRTDFSTIVRNVTVEARLIDDLLDLTRITHNKLPLDLKLRDVHAILRQTTETLQQEPARKKIALTIRLEAPAFTVLGDDVRLQQVFLNLLKNALKFTPAGGSVDLATRIAPEKPGVLRVELTDSGIGLTPAEMARVFAPFTQGEHSERGRASKYGGLGLGLAISREIVELHDGALSAESEGRNRGAMFLVELPLAECAVSSPAEPAFPEPAETISFYSQRRVLLIEDHDASRLALARLLANRKIEVVQAASVAEALAHAQAQTFDLVISDLGLPDGNGYDLMKTLQTTHGCRGIALSGFGAADDIARSEAAGFVAHLTKPVQIQALDRLLARFSS